MQTTHSTAALPDHHAKPAQTLKRFIHSFVLLSLLIVMIPWPVPVFAAPLANCELPDGDIDGDECITQNLPKNNGGNNPDCNSCAATAGDPINIATGNKFENVVDYLSGGPSPLLLRRSYNSFDAGVSAFGARWRGAYSRALIRTSANTVDARRDDGKVLTFRYNGTVWKADSDVNSRLIETASGWQYTTGRDEIERYTAAGRLLSITDRAGLSQNLDYDGQGRLNAVSNTFGQRLRFAYHNTDTLITAVTVPNGGLYRYQYDAQKNLSTVTYPDNSQRHYLYEDSRYPHALTGIIDENGQRYSTDTYDSAGRAISNQLGDGINDYRLDYSHLTNGYVPVTDALGVTRTYHFTNINQIALETRRSQSCPDCPAQYTNTQTTTRYDSNGNITEKTDANGNTTRYHYDLTRNLLLSRSEAIGTAQARTTTITWHSRFRLPSKIVEPVRITHFSYDNHGNLLQKTLTDTTSQQSRHWHFSYNDNGQVISIDGPRSDINDITQLRYDPQGNLSTLTNPLGQTLTFSDYNADGQPLSLQDANGLVTHFQYNLRGQLTALSQGTETTRYHYDAAQQLTQVTLPDGATLSFNYDKAHRLIGLTDTLGNHIDYSLDKMGNHLATQLSDPDKHITQTQTQVFDGLSRLLKTLGAQQQTTRYDYDANGNIRQQIDPLNNVTNSTYDPLNRLISRIDPLGNRMQISYDRQDNPLTITDPLNHTTDYDYDGLKQRLGTQSPDTGLTQVRYDEAGNPISTEDARGQTILYHYDALNRLTEIDRARQAPIQFSYDQGKNGIGHLTQMSDASGKTRWHYDLHGRLIRKTVHSGALKLSTHYQYNAQGQLITLRYPSGKKIQLHYNRNGQITDIDHDGRPQLSDIHYQPDGAVRDWVFGNGRSTYRDFDLDGRLIAYDLGDHRRQLDYDAAGRITAYTDTELKHNQSFSYDALGRLTHYTDANSQIHYQYDANGNRTEQYNDTQQQNYQLETSSNRLLSITNTQGETQKNYRYDAAGNLTNDGIHRYRYDANGQLIQATSRRYGTEHYLINGLGQRIAKIHGKIRKRLKADNSDNNEDGKEDDEDDEHRRRHHHHHHKTPKATYFIYDEVGHLLGEYNAKGKALQETVWLGNQPVAVLKGHRHYYIYSDHLNSPRIITDHKGKEVWHWQSEPFGLTVTAVHKSWKHKKHPVHGEGIAGDNDHKDRKFTYNLRFPGQYFDQETGLYYNYYRDYDPVLGRYIESDPIGLGGGINTYAYVRGNPVSLIDPLGLVDVPNFLFGVGNFVASSAEAAGGAFLMIDSPMGTFAAPAQFYAGLSLVSIGTNGMLNAGMQINYALHDTNGPGFSEAILGFLVGRPGAIAGLLIDSSGGLSGVKAAGRLRDIRDFYDTANAINDINNQANSDVQQCSSNQ